MARHASLQGSLAFGLGFLFGALLGMRLARSWPNGMPARLVRGVSGVAVLLAMESAVALAVLGMPLDTYLESFDITESALFPIGLVVMALAPLVGTGKR